MTEHKDRDPLKSFRVPDSEWQDALAVAKERGDSLSEVLRAALRRYVRRNKR